MFDIAVVSSREYVIRKAISLALLLILVIVEERAIILRFRK